MRMPRVIFRDGRRYDFDTGGEAVRFCRSISWPTRYAYRDTGDSSPVTEVDFFQSDYPGADSVIRPSREAEAIESLSDIDFVLLMVALSLGSKKE